MSQKPLTYADAGVSIDAGNALVKAIGPLARSTARPGADAELGGFGGFFDLKAAGYRDPLLVAANDGVGTKLKLAIETGRHDGVGIDLVAMCANDLIVQGAEPLFFLDYYATGEARQRGRRGGRRIDRRGLPPGRLRADRRRDGRDAGHVRRRRLRPRRLLRRRGRARRGADRQRTSRPATSSSASPARACIPTVSRWSAGIIAQDGWELDERLPVQGGRTLGELLLEPTRIYVRSLLPLVRDGRIEGLAHITGGGLLENIPRVLPEGCHAVVDADRWQLPPLLALLQEGGRIAPEEMARTFNCGIGMVGDRRARRCATT